MIREFFDPEQAHHILWQTGARILGLE